ncbi:MAG TPA: DsrE/DsrF/DrsH-like family protein [Candidatus Binataceae bacterium]|nr:DsrE/DsrF/DrsH-like family protein [Candidatus Binataceae bacterium]
MAPRREGSAANEAIEAVETPAPAAKRLVIVLTKATLDEAYPAFILATTGAATGMEVDIYFTFWGMKLLDKRTHKKVQISPLGNPAMGMPNILAVLPGATALVTAMMKRKIKRYWPTIPDMMKQATELGVRMHACSPTMGLMGLSEKDLIEGVDICGASSFLSWAADNAVTIFI